MSPRMTTFLLLFSLVCFSPFSCSFWPFHNVLHCYHVWMPLIYVCLLGFICWHFSTDKMTATPCKHKGSEDGACYKFLPAKGKDSYDICITCHCQQCNIEVRYDHCKSWTDEHRIRVDMFTNKLAAQREKLKEKKVLTNFFRPRSSQWGCGSSFSSI